MTLLVVVMNGSGAADAVGGNESIGMLLVV